MAGFVQAGTLLRSSWNRRRRPTLSESDGGAIRVSRRDTVAHAGEISQPSRIRLSLRERYELRHAIAYAVESPEGEIGSVTAVRFAPFDYWPEELIVDAPEGARLRVPIDTIAAVLPREDKLLVTTAPAGAVPVARSRRRRLTRSLAWRAPGIAGAVLGLGGFVATLTGLVLDSGLRWAPVLAATGAVGGAAAAVSWRRHGRSWPAAIGLGSFWVPLTVGAILSLALLT